jgi:hypothetical protein
MGVVAQGVSQATHGASRARQEERSAIIPA